MYEPQLWRNTTILVYHSSLVGSQGLPKVFQCVDILRDSWLPSYQKVQWCGTRCKAVYMCNICPSWQQACTRPSPTTSPDKTPRLFSGLTAPMSVGKQCSADPDLYSAFWGGLLLLKGLSFESVRSYVSHSITWMCPLTPPSNSLSSWFQCLSYTVYGTRVDHLPFYLHCSV